MGKTSIGAARIFGHQNGVKSVKENRRSCLLQNLGIKYLTHFMLSVQKIGIGRVMKCLLLMELLVKTIHAETPTLNKNNIRLLTIGDTNSLPEKCVKQLNEAMAETSKNTGLSLVLALSYSAKWEIVNASG